MRVDIYARVSTTHQDVQQQVEYLREFCRKNGYEISSETLDEQSGKVELEQRKKFLNLIQNPKGDALLVYNLDRLSRNWYTENYIEKLFSDNWENYKLLSTADNIDLTTASGRLMFRIKFSFNCFMPEDMREKQAIGIARAKKQGKYKGRIPDKDKK